MAEKVKQEMNEINYEKEVVRLLGEVEKGNRMIQILKQSVANQAGEIAELKAENEMLVAVLREQQKQAQVQADEEKPKPKKAPAKKKK